MARASATVKFQDDQGRTLPVSPRTILGEEKLEGRIVVVRGQVRRDSLGNLTILAQQAYLRPREQRNAKP